MKIIQSEIIQSRKERKDEKKMNRTSRNGRQFIKCINIGVMKIPEEDRKKPERIFEEIMAKTFHLMNNTNKVQIQEAK